MIETKLNHSLDAVLDAMAAYGGGFATGLSRLFRIADSDNRRRLLDAFPEIFAKYDSPEFQPKEDHALDR